MKLPVLVLTSAQPLSTPWVLVKAMPFLTMATASSLLPQAGKDSASARADSGASSAA